MIPFIMVVVWWVFFGLGLGFFGAGVGGVVGFVEGFFCGFFGWVLFFLCPSCPPPQANSYVPHLIMEVTFEIEVRTK